VSSEEENLKGGRLGRIFGWGWRGRGWSKPSNKKTQRIRMEKEREVRFSKQPKSPNSDTGVPPRTQPRQQTKFTGPAFTNENAGHSTRNSPHTLTRRMQQNDVCLKFEPALQFDVRRSLTPQPNPTWEKLGQFAIKMELGEKTAATSDTEGLPRKRNKENR